MLFAVPAFWVSTWRPARRAARRGVGASPHTRLARHLFVLGTTAPPAKEVRVTNTGDWLIAERRAAWERWYRPVAAGRAGRPPLGTPLAWAVFAGAYVGAIVYVAIGPRPRCRRRRAGARRRHAPGSLRRRDGRRARLPPRLLARLVAPADVARGLRRAAIDASASIAGADAPRPTASRSSTCRSATRAPTGWCSTTSASTCRPARSSPSSARTARASPRSSSCWRACTRRQPGGSWSTASTSRDIAIDEWRQRLAGAFQDFYRFELHRAADGRRRRPARTSTIARRAQSAVDRAGAARRDRAARVRARHAARAVVGRRRRGQLRPVAEAGAGTRVHARRPAAAGPRRTDGSARRRDRARAVRTLRRGVAGQHATTGRVTVLVSHRFSTVRMADLIVVLDGAHVVECGSHEELMAATVTTRSCSASRPRPTR